MKLWKKVVLGGLGLTLTAATVFAVPTIWGKPWFIEHFYGRVFLSYLFDHPQLLSGLRLFEPLGISGHNQNLNDYSPAQTRRDFERSKANLEMLRSYDRSALTDKLSYDVLEFFLDTSVDGEAFMFHDYPVNQLFGFQSSLPDFMVNTHQVNRERDAQQYVTRLSKFGIAFDQTLEGIKLRESKGIVPPKFVMTHVLKQMRDFIEPKPTEHFLYTHLAEKLKEVEDLDADAQSALLSAAEKEIEQTIYPAYERMIAHYAKLEPTASTDDGVWKLPDGDKFYAHQLREFTTTNLSAEEIHAIGLEEVERLQAEMKTILRKEGYEADDLAATMQNLNQEERFLYPDTDEGREQILEDYDKIIKEIESGMSDFFARRPEAPVEVRRVPTFKEKTSPGAYYNGPALDGSRPGVFYANLRSVKEIPKFGMRTLAYHEAIPGHHYQIALAQEMEGVPFFRRVLPFTAYSEGWALYSELAAAENGFQDDPYDRLGYLTAQLFRACRLIVDTGIHYKRWPREKAIDTMLSCTGMPRTDVVAEVERYIVLPGQACAYMVGRMEIVRLRDEAQKALGDKFDIRDFHDVVLGNGALPLTLLRRQVEAWYRGEKPSAEG
ncbi:MAG: DUF885 domain-containing protein [Myxococcota bacterium]